MSSRPSALFAVLAPEARSGALLALCLVIHAARGATLQEDFSSDPLTRGWQVHGEATLFSWDSTNQMLRVHWDSSKTNSYFHLPLTTILTRADGFTAAFDIYLEDIAIGTTSGKPNTFPLAVSLFKLADAQRANLFIGVGVTGSGSGLRNAVEFNYFPDAGFGETFAAIAVSATPTNYSQFLYDHDYPTPMDTGVWHRITLTCSGDAHELTLTKTRAGLPYGTAQTLALSDPFADFQLDTFSVSSYSDTIGLGSLSAHGWIDNLTLTVPDPPVAGVTLTLTNSPQVHFQSLSGWYYTLERGLGMTSWSETAPAQPGTGGPMTLTDTDAPPVQAFYRVRAHQP